MNDASICDRSAAFPCPRVWAHLQHIRRRLQPGLDRMTWRTVAMRSISSCPHAIPSTHLTNAFARCSINSCRSKISEICRVILISR